MLPAFDALGLSGLKLLRRGPERRDFAAAIKRGRGRLNHPHADVDPAVGPWPAGYFHDYAAFKVGTGREDYERAVKVVSSWEHADSLPWVSTNAPRLGSFRLPSRRRRRNGDDGDDSEDETSASGLVIAARAFGPLLPFLPLWIVNPLKITRVDGEGRRRGGVPAHGREGEESKRRRRRRNRRPRALVPGRSFSVRASTCSSHVLAGAESFSVFLSESGKESEREVWYEVASFSRPATALSAATLPLVRALQARFREDSARAVAEAVERGRKRGR